MIVCKLCGSAVSHGRSDCQQCSGRVVEQHSPAANVLTPSHRRGGPDRWAQIYTHASPASESGSATPSWEMSGSKRGTTVSSMTRRCNGQALSVNTIDVPLDPRESELARVYGSVLDPRVQHPVCTSCGDSLRAGQKIFIAPRGEIHSRLEQGQELCKQCYSTHFSLGACVMCKQAVLGDKGDGSSGRFMKDAFGKVWHGACFTCSTCASPLYGEQHVVLPPATALCMGCFDNMDEEATGPSSHPTEITTPRGAGRYGRPGQVLSPRKLVDPLGAKSSVDRLSTVSKDVRHRAVVSSMLQQFGQENQHDSQRESPRSDTTEAGRLSAHPAFSSTVRKVYERGTEHDSGPAFLTTSPSKPITQPFGDKQRATDGATLPLAQPSRPKYVGAVSRCPVCVSIVGVADRGVIKGPNGLLWHGNCLRCGQKAAGNASTASRTGCGRLLDGSAINSEGGYVWCRECSFLSSRRALIPVGHQSSVEERTGLRD